jgi:hypothetical protein
VGTDVSKALVTVNVAASSLFIFSLMMEAARSSETLVLTQRHIPEDGILDANAF